MFKFVVLATVVALVAGSTSSSIGFGSFRKFNPKVDPKVVGGSPATLGQFPHQVSLQLVGGLAGGHYCGGSLLSESTVLTAGHCVTEVQIGIFQHIEILAGLVSLANPGSNVQRSRVSKTIVHPDFAGGVAPNDLAIHILTTPFTLNEYVNVINLPQVAETEPTDNVVLSGWGSTSRTQSPTYPDKLQTVTLPIIPNAECKTKLDALEANSPFTKSMVCTGPETGGYGACSGDSGGPLILDGTLIGVVSWGFIPCGQVGAPSVFTNPSYFLDWIVKNTV